MSGARGHLRFARSRSPHGFSLPGGSRLGCPSRGSSERQRVTRGWRGFGAGHMHRGGYFSGCFMERAASFMWGQRLGVRMGLVMLPRGGWCPPAAREGWAGRSRALLSSLPIDNVGNSPKVGVMEVGGAYEIQRVRPKKGLGCRTLPLIPLPSPPAGFAGVTPFCNKTLILLLPGKHKGNPQPLHWSKQTPPTLPKTLSSF